MIIRSEFSEAAKEAFDELTTRQQIIWTLCMKRSLSQGDVARKLGVCQKTVWKSLHMAARKFKKHLENFNGTDEALL